MKTIIGSILLSGIVSLSFGKNATAEVIDTSQDARIETFTFDSDGLDRKGKIYLPAAFSVENSLPSIYLIDFTEQHFAVALDEFEKVIAGVEQIQDLDAVVVTLQQHLDVDSNTGDYQKYYKIFKNMALHVDANYTNNTSRTFIGRGSESGLVMMTLFLEDSATSVFDNFVATDSPASFNSHIVDIVNADDFPKNKRDKKLHFSFSITNNRSSCTALIDKINGAQYPWLQFESFEYTATDYENAYPDAFARGLKYVLSNVSTGIEDDLSTVPTGYQIKQNYPNPFTSNTIIKYSIPKQGYIALKLYDLLGNEVIELVNKEQPVGNYEVELDATLLPSGVYFYTLQANDFVETKKMIMMK